VRSATVIHSAVVAAFAVLTVAHARAQVRDPQNAISAGEHAGPLSDVSRPLHDDSVSVYDGLSIGETSGGPVYSGAMRDAAVRGMLSGAVSDISAGPMRQPQLPLSGGAMTEASMGAVKHDIDSPLGERISEPLRELGPLQEALRARRNAAEQALESATEPALSPADDAALAIEAARRAAAAAPADAENTEDAEHEQDAQIDMRVPAEAAPADADEQAPSGVDDAADPAADGTEHGGGGDQPGPSPETTPGPLTPRVP
jgi:hypothetical protein